MLPNPRHRGDPTFLPDVLRAFGVTVHEFPGWRDRGHGDFGRIIGVVAHHTGSNTTPANFIAHHPTLGLCSQIHLARDGVATIVGAGIAWHAGRGSWPGWPTNNANAVAIGIEAVADGHTPWPPAQYDAYQRICAAICWYLGLPAVAVIGHKEWAGRAQGKWDPAPMDMNSFRSGIAHYITHPPFNSSHEDTDMQFDQIPTRYQSRVDGSPVTLRPIDALLNCDANAWLSAQATRRLEQRLTKIESTLDAVMAAIHNERNGA